jgi:hypothetical protein
MTYRIEVSIPIRAPREVVWDIMQDFTHRTRWDERVVAADVLTPPPPGKGTRFRITYSVLGVRSWAEAEYVTWDPVRRSGVHAVGFSRLSPFEAAAGSWTFTDQGDGTSIWTTKVSMTMRNTGFLTPLLERVVVGWYFRRLTEKSARNLRRLVEAEYTAAKESFPRTASV